jgi:pilus assembly protein CpaF
VTRVTEVNDMEKDTVVTQDIFEFVVTGMDERRVLGHLLPVGIRPKCAGRLEAMGIRLPARIFSNDLRGQAEARAGRW